MDRQPEYHVEMDPEPNLAISLAGTTLAGAEWDSLSGPRQLGGWLEAHGIEVPGLELRLADVRELRSAILALFAAAAEGRSLPSGAAGTLNDASAAAPRCVRLDVRDGVPRAVEVTGAPDAAAAFGRIARSAIGLLGGPDRERLRSCAAPGCGRFFLAERPRHVWCSNACGNRVRVARHHARRRGPSPAQAGTIRSTDPDSESA